MQPRQLPPPPPGMRYARHPNGTQLMLVPDVPSGAGYQRQVALGQPQGSHPTEPQRPSPLSVGVPSDEYPGWLEIPAFYTVTIILGGDPTKPSAVAGEGVVLRPEPFVCRRITWATTGDVPLFVTAGAGGAGSAQGRSVRVEWDDEFTKFLGTSPCLVSALMGDSQGFLDFPRRGVLLQGKQKLTVKLSRVLWPANTNPADTEWDFNFQGVGLLPNHINQSGSAG